MHAYERRSSMKDWTPPDAAKTPTVSIDEARKPFGRPGSA
jgi:hypothetical protein